MKALFAGGELWTTSSERSEPTKIKPARKKAPGCHEFAEITFTRLYVSGFQAEKGNWLVPIGYDKTTLDVKEELRGQRPTGEPRAQPLRVAWLVEGIENG